MPRKTPAEIIAKLRQVEALSSQGVPVADVVRQIEARIVVESWRRFYNIVRPHGSLGYRPPAPEIFIPAPVRAAALPGSAPPPELAQKQSMN